MDCNDLNRRVRYALMLDDDDVIDLLRLVSYSADRAHVTGWRLKEGETGHVPCSADALAQMLDGLIVQRRGPREGDPANAPANAAISAPAAIGGTGKSEHKFVDNNAVLKQLRIALSLKVDEVHALITEGGGKLGKSEVNALFRKPSARNYRRCGDQVLRWFLAGLAERRPRPDLE